MPDASYPLVWQPVGPALEKALAHDDCLLLIVPFIQRGSLVRLLDACKHTGQLKIVTRWRSEDILSKVSDLSIYEELSARRIPLYVNDRIHLKLMVFASNECFVGSANVTNAGLGYGPIQNIEVGCWSSLAPHDWAQVFHIIDGSILVDDGIFEQARQFLNENDRPQEQSPQIGPFEHQRKSFSVNALPATTNPLQLEEYFVSDRQSECEPEIIRRAIHDLVLYDIGESTTSESFRVLLKERFCAQPFVQSIVGQIRARQKMRFGEVNEWIHQHCADVPLPYRWQIKENTHILYDWLSFFYDEIEWKVPGQRSQVIYWEPQ